MLSWAGVAASYQTRRTTMTIRLHLGIGLLLVSTLHAQPPQYTERANLLYYLDGKGEKHPIRTPADWQVRAGHIRASMELVMGPLRPKSTEPLAVEVKS